MKRLIYSIIASAAMMSAPAAVALENYVGFFINPIVVEVEDGIGTVDVWCETDITTLNAFNFNLYLPKGFEIEKDSWGDYDFIVNNKVSRHTISAAPHLDATEPYYTIVGMNMNNRYIATGRNLLFSFNVTAPDDFTAANFPLGAEARIGDMTIAENSTSGVISHHPFASFVLAPGNMLTGIENVTVDGDGDGDGEEVIYDLRGIRVYRPLQPGLYIINGEKVAVLGQ